MKIKIIVLSLCFMILFFVPVSAASYTAYSDLQPTNSYVSILLHYAGNDPDFIFSDYLLAQTGQYEYYLFYGDLRQSSIVSGTDVRAVRYYRSGSSSSYRWHFSESEISSFSFDRNGYIVVTNLDGFGVNSSVFYDIESDQLFRWFFVFVVGLLFVLVVFRRRVSYYG